MEELKTNKAAFYVAEVFVILFLLTIIMGVTLLFKNSYSAPVTTELPSLPFTTNYASTTGSTVNYVNEAFSHCTGTNCNQMVTDNGSAVDSFKVPMSYSISDNSKALYILSKNLGFATSSETFGEDTGNPSAINDAGIKYIMNHGYYNSSRAGDVFDGTYGSVTNDNIKQYITQMALWLYIYEKNTVFSELCANTKDTNVTGCNFNYAKDNGETTTYTTIPAANVRSMISSAAAIDGYSYLRYINELVDKAKTATVNNNFSFDDMEEASYLIVGSTLTSTLVNPTSSNDAYTGYDLVLEDPNNYGAYLVDSSGERINTLTNRTGAFKLVIPLTNDGENMNLTSVKVNVIGHFNQLAPYRYHVTDTSSTNTELINNNKMNNFSDVVLSINDNATANIELYPQNYTLISKTDIANGNELPGAHLTITNTSNNSVVDDWTSTNKSHKVLLEDGNYKLCETTAPEGYAKKTECINFEVTNNKVEKVTMENARIPDTGAGIYKGIYYIGSLLLLIGIGLITTLIFKEKHKVTTTE